jgi:hypothetical protein
VSYQGKYIWYLRVLVFNRIGGLIRCKALVGVVDVVDVVLARRTVLSISRSALIGGGERGWSIRRAYG